jgi:CRP-like cAMP-binding protein
MAAVATNGAEEISAEAGTVVVEACTDDAALFIVLDGEVDIEVGHARCARLGQYAAIGDLAILGVFTKQMATIRAAADCKIVRLPAEALNAATNDERFEKDKARLDALRERLNKQGAEGLKAVRCLKGCHELCRKVLALQAIPLGLEQGQSWMPKPAEHGEVFILALRGRSILTLPGVSGAPVMLKPGDAVPDALMRRFGASLHALDECSELCLLPRHMLLAAVLHFPEARPWFDVLRSAQSALLKSLEDKLRMHLTETAARLENPRDEGISQWAQKRRDAMTRAQEAPRPIFGIGPSSGPGSRTT